MSVTEEELDHLLEGHGLLSGGIGEKCKGCHEVYPCVTVRTVKALKSFMCKKGFTIINDPPQSISDFIRNTPPLIK
jgi:hypothetical protein